MLSTDSFFRHYRTGFSQNPFSALTAVEWTQAAFLPAAIESSVNEKMQHIQLLGYNGSGKTATLHCLMDLLSNNSVRIQYEYIPEGQTDFKTDLSKLDIFVLDEAQRLNWRWRRRWLKWVLGNPQRRTLFASHQDLSATFARKGLNLASFIVSDLISVSHYAQWLKRRLALFALPEMPQATFSEAAVGFLYTTFQSDMRAAEYFLYELFEDLETAVVITPEHLQKAWHNYQMSPNYLASVEGSK